MINKKVHQKLIERIGTDKEFHRSLKGEDEGGEEDEDNDENDGNNGSDGDDKLIHYNGIDSSKTIDAAITDVIKSTPANCLADIIYADESSGSSSESDAEGGGTGTNLDMYTGDKHSTHNAMGWMEWNSK